MTNIVQPFDFNPQTSSGVKTGSFTLASDEYAFVTAYAQNGGTFSIGGTVVLSSIAAGSASTLANVDEGISTSLTFTVPAGSFFEGQVASLNNVRLNGNALLISPETTIFKLGPGGTVDTFSGSTRISGYTRSIGGATAATSLVAEFWVKAGVALNVSGDAKYHISTYKVIS